MKNKNFTSKVSFGKLPLFPKVSVNHGDSYILYTTINEEIEIEIWNYYLGLLPRNLQNEVMKYHRWQDRQNTLFGKLLVFVAYYMVYNEKLDFNKYLRNSFGKPFIKNINFEFNISHSGNMVVCVFSKEQVGIDIEEIRKMNFEYFDSVFTKVELDEIKNSDGLKFYELWTAKEAVVKAIGKGLSISISNIKVTESYAIYNGIKWFKEKIIYDNYYCTKTSQIKNQKSEIIEVKF
tara:strand:- start:1209 stop:1913 length:705 start_codon:yes stop_codon:yes gene_type:complete